MNDTTTEYVPVDTVAKTGWDRADFDETVDRLPRLAESVETIAESSPIGGDLARDLWTALVKPAPRKVDDIPPSHLVNSRIVDELLGADRYRELRQYTLGDKIGAGLGVGTLTEFVKDLHGRLGDVQAKADEAQEARDRAEKALQDLLDGAGVDDVADLPEHTDPTEPDPMEEVNELQAAADDAMTAVADALDAEGPAIGKAVREGLAEAANEAAAEREANSGWGTNPGELARMDPVARLARARTLANPRVKRIAEQFGRWENLFWGAHEKRYELGIPEEVIDVRMSDDIARILPEDMLGLVIPELEADWDRRYLEGQLLTYEMRGTVRKGKGAVIYCGDGSGSMAGLPDEATKGLGLALLRVAKEEKRAFHAVDFGGPGTIATWDYSAPADFNSEKMLSYASTFLDDAGTDFETPLKHALSRLEDEYAATGKTEASVVFVTDGQARVSPTFLKGFLEARERLGFSVYGISVGQSPPDSLTCFCNYVAEIRDFANADRQVADLFQKVAG